MENSSTNPFNAPSRPAPTPVPTPVPSMPFANQRPTEPAPQPIPQPFSAQPQFGVAPATAPVVPNPVASVANQATPLPATTPAPATAPISPAPAQSSVPATAPVQPASTPTSATAPSPVASIQKSVPLPPEFRAPAAPQAAPTEPVAAPAPAAPKNHGKLIALIAIIAGLLIAGIIAAAVVISQVGSRNNPDLVALDAVNNLINLGSTPISVDGKIEITPTEDNDYGFAGMHIGLKGISSVLPSQAEANVSLALEDGGSIDFQAGTVVLKDGRSYFMLSGFAKAMEDYFNALGFDVKANDSSQYTHLTKAYELVSKLDDKWWEIPSSGIAGETSSQNDDKSHACQIAAFGAFASNPSEIVSAYDANRFLTFVKTDKNSANPTYAISVNQPILVNFLTASYNSNIAKNYRSCLGSDTENLYVSTDQSDQAPIGALPTIYAEIDGEHRFSRIYFDTEEDDANISVDLKLNYPANVELSAPAGSSSLSTLFQDIVSIIYSMI